VSSSSKNPTANPFVGRKLGTRRHIGRLCSVRPRTRKELAVALGRPEGALTTPLESAVDAGAVEADDPQLRAGTTYSLTDQQRGWLETAIGSSAQPGQLASDHKLVIVAGGRPEQVLVTAAEEGLAGVLVWAARVTGDGHLLLAFAADAGDLVIDRLAERLDADGAMASRLGIGDILSPEMVRRNVEAIRDAASTRK
jgi:hypothetical protein